MKRVVLSLIVSVSQFCTIEISDPISVGSESAKIAGDELQTVPDVPSGISASGGDGFIYLSWGNSPEATGYRIYDDSNNLVEVSYSNSCIFQIANGQHERFHVSAFNSFGESLKSDVISAMSGIIDNNDGTLTALHLGQTWTKCELGRYNSATNQCDGYPTLYQYCGINIPGACDDYFVLTSGPVYDACASIGNGWRVPTKQDAINFGQAYRYFYQAFGGVIDGRMWVSSANYSACHPDGYCVTPISRLYYYPVRCVK